MTRKAYKTDITEAQWQILQPLIPAAKPGGHPRTANMREVVNVIFYVLRTGCWWEMLPHDLPPYSTVYYYFRRLLLRTTLRERQKTGVWQQMNNALRQRLRQQEGRNPQPSAAIARSAPAKLIADSQSVKTTEKKGEVYGFDGGKLVKGRKRHLVVDTQGLLLGVVVTEANTQDRLGGFAVLMEQACESGRLELLWVDQGYSGEKFAHAICASQQRFAIAFLCGAKVEVVKRTEAGFQVLPRRWVVERNEGLVGTLSTPQ